MVSFARFWRYHQVLVFCLVVLTLSASPVISVCPSAQEDILPAGVSPDSSAAVEAVDEDIPLRACITLKKGGKIVMELLVDDAPLAVERFITLVRSRFYDGMRFHRAESFVVQTGKKDHDYPPLRGEMFDQELRHKVGMVGMARKPNSYDSATTQFYIVKEYRASLNGEYTLFARVIEGMDIVQAIKKNDKIISIEIID